MVSFDRLRRRVDKNLTDEDFRDIIANNRTVFRDTTIASNEGPKPGLAKWTPSCPDPIAIRIGEVW